MLCYYEYIERQHRQSKGEADMAKHTDGIQIMKIEESDKFDTFTEAADEMENRGGGWVEWWDANDNVEKRWVA